MPFLFRIMLLGMLPVVALASKARADSQPVSIPALIQALDDPNVRFGASRALTKRGVQAVPALRKSLVSGKRDLAVWSAYTLGQIGPAAEPAVGDLTKALGSSDKALRAAAVQSLGKIGPSAAAAVNALADALRDENEQVRKQACIALGQIGPPAKKAVGKLITVLADDQLRKSARVALIQIGTSAADPLLKSLDDDKIRFDVSLILSGIDPERAKQAGLDKAAAADLPSLRTVLYDSNREPGERTAAAAALASLGGDAVKVLIDAFEEEEKIARTAAAAFAEVGAVAVPSLIDALADEKPQVRSRAADALGHVGPAAADALPKLVGLLNDKDRNVRYHAVRALHNFRRKASPAISPLIEVIGNSKETEATRQWAIKTLLVTLPQTHDVVVKALIKASKDKANYGVSQLARQQVRAIDLEAAEEAGVK